MVTFQAIVPIFPTTDVARALSYYQKLGFEVQPYAGDPVVYGFAECGGVQLQFTRHPDLDPTVGGAAAYLYVDDADALHAQWTAAGVEGRFGPLRDTPWGLREGTHVDPDGNLIRYGSPLPV